MGEVEFMGEMNLVAFAVTDGRGGPLADAVDSKDCGRIERGREESAGGVGFVMLGEKDGSFEAAVVGDVFAHPEFIAEPDRQSLQEGSKTARSVIEIGFEQALEFEKRLVVEDN